MTASNLLTIAFLCSTTTLLTAQPETLRQRDIQEQYTKQQDKREAIDAPPNTKPRADAFVDILGNDWWIGHSVPELHDTSLIPWSMPVSDIIYALQIRAHYTVDMKIGDHKQEVATVAVGRWTYLLSEEYAGSGLRSITMFRSTDTRNEILQDSTSWAKTLASGRLAPATDSYNWTEPQRHINTRCSLYARKANTQRGVWFLKVDIVHREFNPSILGGTRWLLTKPKGESAFLLTFHTSDPIITVPCSSCHTSTWMYHIRNGNEIQIWASMPACPDLCLGVMIPAQLQDMLGTWGEIDEDTMTFGSGDTTVELNRMK